MSRRVVVTGLGAITPIGNNVEAFWNGLKEKKVGIGPITYFDTADYKAKLAGEVIWIPRLQSVWRNSVSLQCVLQKRLLRMQD